MAIDNESHINTSVREVRGHDLEVFDLKLIMELIFQHEIH